MSEQFRIDIYLGWRDKKCMQNFGGETFEKRTLGRPRRRWKDNINMGLSETL